MHYSEYIRKGIQGIPDLIYVSIMLSLALSTLLVHKIEINVTQQYVRT